MDVLIKNETAQLKKVILGIATDFGGTPKLEETYDPWSKYHIQAGTFPKENELSGCLDQFKKILEKYHVEVLRPQNIPGLNQIFMRDIGFVIGNKFVISNVIEDRAQELEGIKHILKQIPKENILQVPDEAHIEGGDVLIANDHIFIGMSSEDDFEQYKVARTNQAGIEFLRAHFPEYEITPLELIKSDTEPRQNVLHLDCCFQPIGENMAILCPSGFKNKKDSDRLLHHFGPENVIALTHGDMAKLFSNLFSISPNIIVSDHSFEPLNTELAARGFTVEKIDYKPIRKMSGLFRCSTLPLYRIDS